MDEQQGPPECGKSFGEGAQGGLAHGWVAHLALQHSVAICNVLHALPGSEQSPHLQSNIKAVAHHYNQVLKFLGASCWTMNLLSITQTGEYSGYIYIIYMHKQRMPCLLKSSELHT